MLKKRKKKIITKVIFVKIDQSELRRTRSAENVHLPPQIVINQVYILSCHHHHQQDLLRMSTIVLDLVVVIIVIIPSPSLSSASSSSSLSPSKRCHLKVIITKLIINFSSIYCFNHLHRVAQTIRKLMILIRRALVVPLI